MGRRWDPAHHRVFRWSKSLIRTWTWSTGLVVTVCGALLAVVVVLNGSPSSTRLELLGLCLAVTLAAGLLAGFWTWAVLVIARASTGTIVFPDGLLIRQALWLTRFVAWEDIASVEVRDVNGWNYAFIRRISGGPEVPLSLEMDDPEALRSSIRLSAPADNPLQRVFA